MCGIPPFQYTFFCAVFPLLCHIWFCLGFQQSWESGKFQLARWSNRMFFCVLLGPSWIINLAQLVSPSVALPAELVIIIIWFIPGISLLLLHCRKDFGFANIFITPRRVQIHDMSSPYYIDRACFVVPSPKVRGNIQFAWLSKSHQNISKPMFKMRHCIFFYF